MFLQKRLFVKLNRVILALAVILAMLTPMVAHASENFSTLSLNNKVDQENALVKKVAGETGSEAGNENNTTLRVYLEEASNTVVLYRIADVDYDVSSGYSVDWTPKVRTWITEQEYPANPYGTPISFVKADKLVKDAFYKAMLHPAVDTNIVVPSDDDDTSVLEAISVVTPEDENAANSVTFVSGADASAGGKHYLEFYRVPFGLYAIIASNTAGKTFNPTVVEIYPDQASPNGAYYVKSRIDTNLKDSQATIQKFVNGSPFQDVAIGEKVEFTIDVGLPSMYRDRDESAGAAILAVEDEYSKSFDYLRNLSIDYNYYKNEEVELPEGGTEMKDVLYTETFAKYAGADAEDHPNDGAVVSYNTFISPSTYASYTDEQKAQCVAITEENLEAVVYNNGDGIVQAGWYYKVESGPIYTLDTSVEGHPTVYFNVQALKSFVSARKEEIGTLNGVVIKYDATVSDQIEINSEENINTARLTYETNAQGELTTIEAVAKVYTYGLNLVKLDGASKANGNPVALAGAAFTLYREVCTFDVTDADNVTVFKKFSDKDATEYDYASMKINTVDYYFTEPVDTEVEAGEGNVTTRKLTTAYKLVTGGSVLDKDGNPTAVTTEGGEKGWFRSNADLEGIVFKGLKVGNYILHEEVAPDGYNRVRDDMLFSIVGVSKAEAEIEFQGSLAGFYDGSGEDRQYIANGIYQLEVLNYKGLVLPSTGGMGTMLFTILGIFMMSVVIVIVIAKRRPVDYEKYIM